MKNKLIKLKATFKLREWTGDMSIEEFYRNCPRGPWLMWLYGRMDNCDLRKVIQVGTTQIEPIQHLLTDERSRKALEVAKAFAKGEATEADLEVAEIGAWNAAWELEADMYYSLKKTRHEAQHIHAAKAVSCIALAAPSVAWKGSQYAATAMYYSSDVSIKEAMQHSADTFRLVVSKSDFINK